MAKNLLVRKFQRQLKSKSKPDYILLGAVVLLIIIGVLALASISAPLSEQKFGNPTHFLFHQLIFGLLPGIVLAVIAYFLPLSFLKKIAPILMLISLIFLILVFFPRVGRSIGGASRWVNLGFFSFQPSELLKLTFILYLAAWLESRLKSKSISLFSNFLLFLIIIGLISFFLILQPDISTLGLIVIIGALMYFILRTPLWHSIVILLTGIGGLLLLVKIAPYRLSRVLVFLKPDTDPMGIGYQIKETLITIGSGGWFGTGLGMSKQKFGLLPNPMSDSIFAIISEEIGFIGGLILILLFGLIAWRGVKILKKNSSIFAQSAALGISSWLVIQALINVGSMTGILPLTGIPLPFISYGGSHLVAELAGVGILLNISKK